MTILGADPKKPREKKGGMFSKIMDGMARRPPPAPPLSPPLAPLPWLPPPPRHACPQSSAWTPFPPPSLPLPVPVTPVPGAQVEGMKKSMDTDGDGRVRAQPPSIPLAPPHHPPAPPPPRPQRPPSPVLSPQPSAISGGPAGLRAEG